MKAALLIKSEEMTVVDDWPEPQLTRIRVIVQLTGLGICGSDLAVWSGRRPPAKLPRVPVRPHLNVSSPAMPVGAGDAQYPVVFETSGSRDGIHSSVELVEAM